MKHQLLAFMNRVLHYAETRRCGRTGALPFAPIFIIGAPRCGSTLLYQVLTAAFDVAYFRNVHAVCFGGPSYVEACLRVLPMTRNMCYRSRFGKVPGWSSPSENGPYWYRFFRRRPTYVPMEAADPIRMTQLRASVDAIVRAASKPLLIKNLYNALRLQPLAAALPEALFIVLHRRIVDNAVSLLEARRQNLDSYDRWWSAEPPEIDQLRALPPHEQVVQQILHIYALIDADARAIGTHRFAHVGYEAFCENTSATLDKLEAFFGEHNLHVPRSSAIPAVFPRRQRRVRDSGLHDRLVAYIDDLERHLQVAGDAPV